MRYAIYEYVMCEYANMRHAKCEYANIRICHMRSAICGHMRSAICGMRYANIRYAVCEYAICEYAICEYAICDMQICDIRICDMRICDMRICDMRICEYAIYWGELGTRAGGTGQILGRGTGGPRNPDRYCFLTIRTPKASLVGEKGLIPGPYFHQMLVPIFLYGVI